MLGLLFISKADAHRKVYSILKKNKFVDCSALYVEWYSFFYLRHFLVGVVATFECMYLCMLYEKRIQKDGRYNAMN
jgi:hypothetical protein